MASRSPNGEGSIVKRSDGRWQVAVTLASGKRKYYYRKTKKLALEALRKHHIQTARMGGRDASRQLFRYYLRAYIERNALEVKERTTEIKEIHEKRLAPLMGNVPLSEITPALCQKAINTIARDSGIRTAHQVRGLISNVLGEAARLELIPRNPCENIRAPKYSKKEMTLWQPEQLRLFLKVAESHRLYALFYLAVATGMRRGELLGLRWLDVSPDSIRIEQIIASVRNRPTVTTPKTKGSRRTIAITPRVYSVLMAHQERQLIEFEAIPEYIFANTLGEPTAPRILQRAWRDLHTKARAEAAAQGLELPYLNMHSLRHMHASILIENGEDPAYVAGRLGHASPSFTLDIYTHLFEERKRRAPADVDDWFDTNSDTNRTRERADTDVNLK
jgi:integrase